MGRLFSVTDAVDSIVEPIEINSNRNLLWFPGEGLMAVAAGQNALGEWQEGAGILTANPDLWKTGVANQVGSGFTEAAGNYIHAVAGRRLFSVTDAVDSIVEPIEINSNRNLLWFPGEGLM